MKRAYATSPEIFEKTMKELNAQIDREVDEYRNRMPHTRLTFDSEGYAESCLIPLAVASCPCCGNSLIVEFDEWFIDDKQPDWDSMKVDCSRGMDCFKENESHEANRMPYVYWLPIENTCRDWVRSHWTILMDKSGVI